MIEKEKKTSHFRKSVCAQNHYLASLFATILLLRKMNNPGHVHVHSIQINVQKQDRVSVTEGQLPASGL